VGDVEHLAQFKPEVRSELRATIRSDRFRDAKMGIQVKVKAFANAAADVSERE
jgi:hypothetical protein